MPRTTETQRLRVYLIIFVAVLLTGTVGFMSVEGLSFLDALYFTIVTMGTVGYGDIVPHTDAGKLLDIFLVVAGVGTFVGVVANATELFIMRRDQKVRQQKLNMVIGLFFSETGTALLRLCTRADRGLAALGSDFTVTGKWTEDDFDRARTRLKDYSFAVAGDALDLPALRDFLAGQGSLIVRLLESPYMLEHDLFTDLLIATLHLKEELELRPGFTGLPDADRQHLAGDVNRVYGLLARQWLEYMAEVKVHYPFLFSLALRTNPFNPEASVVVRA
ncbi:MAG: two pore domain potassium channel family protein [Deltaproteobacteria bacterium]|nr:MAG: two pore domain potassium channel family protein [Deltaproteobacteria bacterium]